jgi:hypothetical protein
MRPRLGLWAGPIRLLTVGPQKLFVPDRDHWIKSRGAAGRGITRQHRRCVIGGHYYRERRFGACSGRLPCGAIRQVWLPQSARG